MIFRKLAAVFCALTLTSNFAPAANAGLVGTDEVVQRAQSGEQRAQLIEMMERDAVREELEALGVNPTHAAERVQRMTDAEVAELHGRIEQARAGGIHEIALVVFIVFVITDAVGATDIFPFVKPVD